VVPEGKVPHLIVTLDRHLSKTFLLYPQWKCPKEQGRNRGVLFRGVE